MFTLLWKLEADTHNQGRLTINNRYTQRKLKLKFAALLKGDDLKILKTVKNKFIKHHYFYKYATGVIYRSICRNCVFW